ncbi:MAG: tRNA 2-thiouridine(34) synthase MnmA, partial [Methylobacterium sp.]
TTRDQLAFSRFPLGDMPDKAAVRAEAVRLGLAVAEKPDSQDICFVPSGKYTDLLAKLRPEAMATGEIVDEAGIVQGRHKGLAHYTIGQSKGLGTASTLDGSRQAVLGLDAARNRVMVGPRSAGRQTIALRQLNWLTDEAEVFRCEVKLRAREMPHGATVRQTPAGATVELDEPSFAAPGQACVMYRQSRLIGGGFIAAETCSAD